VKDGEKFRPAPLQAVEARFGCRHDSQDSRHQRHHGEDRRQQRHDREDCGRRCQRMPRSRTSRIISCSAISPVAQPPRPNIPLLARPSRHRRLRFPCRSNRRSKIWSSRSRRIRRLLCGGLYCFIRWHQLPDALVQQHDKLRNRPARMVWTPVRLQVRHGTTFGPSRRLTAPSRIGVDIVDCADDAEWLYVQGPRRRSAHGWGQRSIGGYVAVRTPARNM